MTRDFYFAIGTTVMTMPRLRIGTVESQRKPAPKDEPENMYGVRFKNGRKIYYFLETDLLHARDGV